jgi:amino acid transporter
MRSKYKISRRTLSNMLLILTLILVALYNPIIGTAPQGNYEASLQWLVNMSIYVAIVTLLILTVLLLAVREIRTILDSSREERVRLLKEMISNLSEQGLSGQKESHSS